ncbi:MAG: acetyl-CoA carboxylase, carboxyltransferase subunit beta [Simkaniaceae bacterium]|nr:acetyl-CoA carboxylase, carboxyltransferase subunit beta [Simkaniaceae bacterium]
MRLFSKQKPKIKVQSSKRDGFSGWIKCSDCQEMVHATELKENLNRCPKCDFHYRINVNQRIDLLCDKESFNEMWTELSPTDPLSFVDKEPYTKRIQAAQEKVKRKDAVVTGEALVDGQKVAIGILDFSFMAGSMGSVVGEKLTRLIEYAIQKRLPVVIVSSSGGARMQESTLSLMQMAKVSAALAKLSDHKLPYISILTNPTTGGVTASFASLGDINIAEPKALIAFAGPRVVEQTIGEKLPSGAQRSEFLIERGMIDCIATRSELKSKLSFFLRMLTKETNLVSPVTKQKLETLIEAAATVH